MQLDFGLAHSTFTPAAGAVTVGFRATGALAFTNLSTQTTVKHDQNFEVTADASLAGGWAPAPAALVAGTAAVRVDGAAALGAAALAGVRYAWPSIPRGQQLYDAAGLPAAPFLARCDAGGCALVAGGAVPA